ncbi:rRNA-processing protein bfr2, partial [Coemansia sp. RSA 2320]
MGPKYVGSRVSRRDLYDGQYGESSEEDSATGEGAEEESAEEESSDEAVDSDEEEKPVPTYERRGPAAAGDSDNDSIGNSDNDSDSDDSSGASAASDAEDFAIESNDRIRDEIKRLEEGERALLRSITQTARSEVEKGQHVVNQTRLWEGALDARIRVQKLVTAANELPQHDQFDELVECCFNSTQASIEEGSHLESARQSVRLLLGSLVDLRKAVSSQSPSATQAQAEAAKARSSSKRKVPQSNDDDDELASTWGELEELRGEFQPFRNDSLEKWSNR